MEERGEERRGEASAVLKTDQSVVVTTYENQRCCDNTGLLVVPVSPSASEMVMDLV